MNIELILQSIGIWAVALFYLRVAIAGNPLYTLVFRRDPTFLERVDQVVVGERQAQPSDPETAFLRSFSRLVLLELLLLGLELGMLVFFLLDQQLILLAWGLLGKNAAMVVVSGWGAALRKERGLFASIRNLPRWMVVADRASSLISGVGFIAFLLAVNGFLAT